MKKIMKCKRLLSTLAVILSLNISSLTYVASANSNYDVNRNGQIDTLDALVVLKTVVGLDDTYKINCDVDNDGNVSTNDALMILKYVVGLSDTSSVVTPIQNERYYLNPDSMKFHCSSCRTIKDKNDYIATSDRQWAIDNGYVPCKVCKP